MDAQELVRREKEFDEEYAKRLAATHANIDALHAPPPSEPVKSDSVVNTVTQDGYTVSTELEYATLPAKESKVMNLLVTATPPPTDAVELDEALALAVGAARRGAHQALRQGRPRRQDERQRLRLR